MEEQQIQEFVHRISQSETLRQELTTNAEAAIEREGFSPRVAQIVSRLVPHLTAFQLEESEGYWI